MFRLLINSEEADLSQGSRIQMSRLVLDISDISKRGINISNRIKLPFTIKNDRLTGYPSRLNSNNKSFERTYPYKLVDQNNILSVGNLLITDYDPKEGITVQLAEGYDFWATVGSKKLNDLDLSNYDVVFNATEFNNLKVKTDSPFLWSLASHANDTTETALNNLVYSRPMYRFRRVLDFIVEQAGYSIDYDLLFTQTNIDNIGFLSNHDNFSVSDNKRTFNEIEIGEGDLDLTVGILDFSKAGNVVLSGNTLLVNQLYKTSYVIKGEVESNFDTFITITTDNAGDVTDERIIIPKGTTFINFRTDEVEINSQVKYTLGANIRFNKVRIYSHINESEIGETLATWESPADTSVLDGYLILADYNLMNITQHQFIKVLIKLMFLKVDIDEMNKTVMFSSFADVITENNAIDLSGKAQRFSGYSSSKAFNQLNIMRYENEDDIDSELGQTTFNIDNENAKPSGEYLVIGEFSASKETIAGGNTTINAFIYTIADGTRRSIKPRIVNFSTGTGIPFTAQFKNVSMSQYYSSQYVRVINSIKRERLLSTKLLLSFTDFNRINRQPVAYISEYGGYFLILQISGFEVGVLTSVKMVKYG